MDLTHVHVVFTGVSPLFHNKMSEDQLYALWSKEKRQTTNQSRPATPREDAARKVYQLADGTPFIPAVNLMSCLIAAGVFIKLDGKRQLSNAQSSLLPGMLSIQDHVLPLKTPGWEADMRQGRNPNGGEAVCIVRPRFDEWSFEVDLTIDLSQLPETRFRELIDIAGSRVGLGDFRPSRKGTFGRFVVKSWDHVASSVAAE